MSVVQMGVERLKILIPDLRLPEFEHLYRDPKLAGLSKIARDYAVEMAYSQYAEQAILAGMFGNCAGMVRTTIAAGTAATTTIATGSLANGGASGNMDQTPNTTAIIATGHPGAGATVNQYTVPQFFKLTNSAATSLTVASQTTATAVTVGDAIFLGGSSSAGGATSTFPAFGMAQQLYIGLSTAAFNAGQVSILSGEPTSTGSYARIGAGTSAPATLWNNQANWPLPTAASPSVLTTANGPWSFAQSSAGFSTGATNLVTMFIADATTLGGGNILAIGQLTTAQAVNAANITLSFATGAITLTLT